MTLAVVLLAADGLVADAWQDRLRAEPGLGAVLAPDRSALVTHAELLAACPHDPGLAPDAWLRAFVASVAAWQYRVEHADGSPVVLPAGPSARVEALARALRPRARERARTLRQRWRRGRFLWRLRKEAWLSGAQLELDVAKDLQVEPGVLLELGSGRVRVEIGPQVVIRSGVLLRLAGDLVVGPGATLRHGAGLNAVGRLELGPRTTVARGAMVHAHGHLVLEWGAVVAEYATVLDSDHGFDALTWSLRQPVRHAPVRLGAGSFVGAKSCVLPGVTLGPRAVVGAGSIVARDVPERAIVVGSPARQVATLPVPERVR